MEKRWNLADMGLDAQHEHVEMRFSLYVPASFDFVNGTGGGGGKWPGLGGKASGSVFDLAWGGARPGDSWTARMSFGTGGEARVYLYAEDPVEANYPYGATLSLGAGTTYYERGWNDIRMRVRMNTPGVSDGELKVWLNGHLGLERNDIQYRSASYPSLGASVVVCHAGFGGSTSDYPDTDQQLHLGQFSLWAVEEP